MNKEYNRMKQQDQLRLGSLAVFVLHELNRCFGIGFATQQEGRLQ